MPPTGHLVTFPMISQALKEEGTTAVSAVFLAPPRAELKEAPAQVEDAKPKVVEAGEVALGIALGIAG